MDFSIGTNACRTGIDQSLSFLSRHFGELVQCMIERLQSALIAWAKTHLDLIDVARRDLQGTLCVFIRMSDVGQRGQQDRDRLAESLQSVVGDPRHFRGPKLRFEVSEQNAKQRPFEKADSLVANSSAADG